MRVIVFGATGSIGHLTVQELLNAGGTTSQLSLLVLSSKTLVLPILNYL